VVRPLVPGAPRRPGDLLLCPRVCPLARYAANAGFTLAEKTSMGQTFTIVLIVTVWMFVLVWYMP
jgi:hypothetical protein